MLLEINPLVLPDIGLVFWNTVAFLLLLVVLGKFAWKPILKAINDREQGIEDALARADKMKSELATMQSENEALLAKAREERATLIKEAKEKAKAQYDAIVADAQVAINQQKNAALTDVKNQVGALVIEVAEKVLHKELSNKAAQETYINELAEGVKLN